jgi:hypothetical protein
MKTTQIAVIGLGTAGVQTLCHYITWSKNTVVTSIHAQSIPSVGIGESTNGGFVDTLEQGLNFELYKSVKQGDMDCTLKLGTQYINWRNYTFQTPLLNGSAAIHFNTHTLQEFALSRLRKRWGDKFKELTGVVDIVENSSEHVILEINGLNYAFDYVIDCRGWPKDYTDYTMVNQPVNHCLVHNVMEGADWHVTKHIATENGWMFGIPLTTRTSYGYLFNDTLTHPDIARENFSKTINVPVDQLDTIEYKFNSYYTNKLIDNRIIKNGNRAVFFEPMFANSLFIYQKANLLSWDYIFGKLPKIPQTINLINAQFAAQCKSLEEMIAFHYHGGSTYDTPFWKMASEISKAKLDSSIDMQNMLATFKRMREENIHEPGQWVYPTRGLEIVDIGFDYNYFSRR